MSKKIISLFLSVLIVVGIFIVAPGASDSTPETVTDLSDPNAVEESTAADAVSTLSATETDGQYSLSDYQYGKYFSFFERIITNNDSVYDDEELKPISKTSNENTGEFKDFSTLFSWASDGSARVEKLRLIGWVLTDSGVRKYAVRVNNGSDLVEYDVYNYTGGTVITNGVNEKALNEGLVDYAHNVHYDIDVDLQEYVNKTVNVSVWAYTNKGEVLNVLSLTNIPVASSVLSTSDNVVCRYCNGSTYYTGVFPDKNSHDYCALWYDCMSCNKSVIRYINHRWSSDLNSNGVSFCLSCGFEYGSSCFSNEAFVDSLFYINIGDYHVKSYSCVYCGIVNSVEEHIPFVLYGDCPDKNLMHCYRVESCAVCNEVYNCECIEHNFIDQKCSNCFFELTMSDEEETTSDICNHNYKHSNFVHVGTKDICAYEILICSNCSFEIREIISSHVMENGVCIICEYSEDDSCIHHYEHLKFEYVGKSNVCAYEVLVCSKCNAKTRLPITDHKLFNGICEICGFESEHIYIDGVCINCGKQDLWSKLFNEFEPSTLALLSFFAIIELIILIAILVKKPRRRR